MKRALATLLLLSLLTLSLLSCGGGAPVTEEELFPAVRTLLEGSQLVNTVMIGPGIPKKGEAFDEYVHDEGYSYADEAWCEERGLGSVADIRTATEAVYTAPVANILYRKALSTDHDMLGDYRDRALGRGILVLTAREGWYTDTENEYLFDTMTLTEAAANTATVSLTVRVTRGELPPQERTLTLPLVRGKDGVWRCDKLTYVAYDEGLNEENKS